MKSKMRSKSESLQGQVIKSQWSPVYKEENHSYKVNIRLRKVVSPDGKIDIKTDYTVLLVESAQHNGIINTEFGLVCANCMTSDYLQDQYNGKGWNREYAGCTCTRCNAATLK